MHRRDFLELSASLAAFAAVPAARAASGSAKPGMITGIALSRDCAAVCNSLEAMAGPAKAALSNRLDIVSLGDIIPSGAARLTALLDSKDDKRHALALGYLIGRAISRDWAPADAPAECATYQDAHILRELSTAPRNVSAQSMEKLLYTISRRLMVGIHTFEPDAEDVENWIVRLVDWDERTNAMHREYAVAFAAPDRSKLKRYVESVSLFDQQDSLIAAAAQLRRGAQISAAEMDAAMRAKGTSLYGKALRAAVSDLSSASEYMAGRMDGAQLRKALALS